MEYEGTFTEDDAENDGEIKRYAGKQSAQIAARQDSQLYQMFLNVCERKGLEPWEVLGDHIVRALNNESHAELLSNTEVNMSKLQQGSIRMEDAEFLKEFAETLGINLTEEEDDSGLDDIFEQRLKSQLQSPLSGMSDKAQGDTDKELVKEIKRLRRELDEVKSGKADGEAPSTEYVRSEEPEQQDVDEAFDNAMDNVAEDDEPETEDVQEPVDATVQEVEEDVEEEEDNVVGEFDDEVEEEDGDEFSLEPDIAVPEDEGIPASNDAEVDNE